MKTYFKISAVIIFTIFTETNRLFCASLIANLAQTALAEEMGQNRIVQLICKSEIKSISLLLSGFKRRPIIESYLTGFFGFFSIKTGRSQAPNNIFILHAEPISSPARYVRHILSAG